MHSKRYKEALAKIDKTQSYPIIEAVKLVKETSNTKFDSSMEVHIRLGIDTKKGEQLVRGSIVLPHGTGKSKRIAVFTENVKSAQGADLVGGEELIKKIKTSGKIDFDIAIATPEIMKKLATIAKILGPKGLMPAPKSGTVVPEKDLSKAIEEIKKGKINFRNDDTGNIHQIIGKASWDDKKLAENYITFIEAITKAKPDGFKGTYIRNIALTSSMGPSVKIAI